MLLIPNRSKLAPSPGARRDGASFDRFGMSNIAVAGGSYVGYVGDPTLNGAPLLQTGGSPAD